jgi:hypothetical protein
VREGIWPGIAASRRPAPAAAKHRIQAGGARRGPGRVRRGRPLQIHGVPRHELPREGKEMEGRGGCVRSPNEIQSWKKRAVGGEKSILFSQ